MVCARIARDSLIFNLICISLSSLTKNHHDRPKYPELLEQPFIKRYERQSVDVCSWFASEMKR